MNECEYSFKHFLPLIIIFSLITLFAMIRLVTTTQVRTIQSFLYDFMGAFFIVFGCFKIANLPAFTRAYSMYDVIAQKMLIYAYFYPFIEVALGVCYLMRWQLVVINSITLCLMLLGTASVASALMQKKKIVCACLGALFSIPMTYVSLVENLLMAVMALGMLLLP